MSISKRDFLALGAAAGASMALPAWAQAKPLFDTLNMFVQVREIHVRIARCG